MSISRINQRVSVVGRVFRPAGHAVSFARCLQEQVQVPEVTESVCSRPPFVPVIVSVTGTNPIDDYKPLKGQCLRSTGKTQRRGRDSNPRTGLSPLQHFQCCAFGRSATSPHAVCRKVGAIYTMGQSCSTLGGKGMFALGVFLLARYNC
jgi:hypothetical protein